MILNEELLTGLLIPFIGTAAGASCVFFLKKDLKVSVQKALTGFAAGVFYYFQKEEIKKLFKKMAESFPEGVLVFDCCNELGAKMMRKTWLKEAGISDVSAYFSLKDKSEIEGWSNRFKRVSERSYMRGYRDIYHDVGFFHKLMLVFCDRLVKMKIIRIEFGKEGRG